MRKSAVIQPIGMNRDLAMSKFDARFAYENKNLRLVTDDANSALVLTNERGPEQIAVWFHNDRTDTWAMGNLYGSVLGVASLDNHLVLFTHGLFKVIDPDTQQEVLMPRDRIYRVDFEDEATDGMPVKGYELYRGNLGFKMQNPIETLPFYETEDIKKVYWTDGLNQPRMINIMADTSSYNDKSFDFAQEISGHEHITVSRKDNTNGMFPSGTVQYAMTYYKRYGQESSVAAVSAMSFIADDQRGASPEETVSCSFDIRLSGLSKGFDGVRIYSIVRTSLNGTPVVKRVADLTITPDMEYVDGQYREGVYGHASYVDGNTTGEDVESTFLLYVGAKEITVQTMAQKDNTAFYGNIKEKHSRVSDSLRSKVKLGMKTGGAFSSLGFANEKTIALAPMAGAYDWESQLRHTADAVRFFQYRETYRFGVQFQDKFGNWSDVVRLESDDAARAHDFYQGLAPQSDVKDAIRANTDVFQTPQAALNRFCALFKGSMDVSTIDDLLDDYVAVRPVVVYPEYEDRSVLAQGVLTPTVYNMEDRVNNSIYGQMSWFSRPMVSVQALNPVSIDNIEEPNQVTNLKTLEVRHYQPLPPYNRYYLKDGNNHYYGGNCELVCNMESYKSNFQNDKLKTTDYTFWANVYPYQEKDLSDAGIPKNVRATQLRSEFFVDQSVETFHSPDVEYKDDFANMDMDGVKMRVVGVVPVTYHTEGVYMAAERASADNYFHVPNRQVARGASLQAAEAHKQFAEFGGIQADHDSKFTPSNCRIVNINGDSVDFQGEESNVQYWGTNKVYPWHTKTLTSEVTDLYKENTYIYDWIPGTANSWSGVSIVNDFVGTPKTTLSKKIYDSLRYSYDTLYFDNAITQPIDKPTYFNTVNNGPVVLDVDGARKMFDFNVDKNVVPNTRKSDGVEYLNGFVVPGMGVLYAHEHGGNDYTQQVSTSRIFSAEAVPMRYKSTSALVFHLSSEYDGVTQKYKSRALPKYISYNDVFSTAGTPRERSEIIKWRGNQDVHVTNVSKVMDGTMSYLWDERCGGMVQSSVPVTDTLQLLTDRQYGFFYLAELYREESDIHSRFGGESEEALAANNWVPCGDAVPLRASDGTLATSVEIKWTMGDTYYQRYDNLHTFPNADEDENQIVDIVSFMCETRVNIDGRYDRNRGLDNKENTRPTNANRLNTVYGQVPNYFRYRALDHNRLLPNEYPVTVAWTKTKQRGEWVDMWTNVTLANTIDMDGGKGDVKAIRQHFNDLLVFQSTGISRILFNEQQAVQTTAGVPLEIANSGKVTGKHYINPTVGCNNKWSIGTSPVGTYFMDDANGDIMVVNGERRVESVASAKGFNSWARNNADMAHTWNPERWQNMRALWDKKNAEMMFVTGKEALSFSEKTGYFSSFYDYERVPFLESVMAHNVMMRSQGGFGFLDELQPRTVLYEHNAGRYNDYFGFYKPFWTELLAHSDGSDKDSALMDKTWTNVSFQFDTFDDAQTDVKTRYKEGEHFDKVDCETEYQKGSTAWKKRYPGIGKKFRMWHADLPRDGYTEELDGYTADRLRNPWLRMRLTKNKNINKNYRSVLHSIQIGYLE